MSWFSKQLKRTTKILDPVGAKIRKGSGGSYGDPLNQYNSKPNTTTPWKPTPSPGLMSAPNGQQSLATMNLGGNTGGRTYTPNPFQAPQGPAQGGAMGFGGPQQMPPIQGGMQMPGMAGSPMQPPPQQQPPPQLGQQQAMIQALRGRMM